MANSAADGCAAGACACVTWTGQTWNVECGMRTETDPSRAATLTLHWGPAPRISRDDLLNRKCQHNRALCQIRLLHVMGALSSQNSLHPRSTGCLMLNIYQTYV